MALDGGYTGLRKVAAAAPRRRRRLGSDAADRRAEEGLG